MRRNLLWQKRARSELWGRGRIADWYLRPSQQDIYRCLLSHRQPFVEASRQFGKTTSILITVQELLLKNPGWVCRWCEPNKNQAREIVMPEMAKQSKIAPLSARPKWQSTDSFYIYPNGSRLYLRGVNEDAGESARGAFAHIVVADEFGTWRHPGCLDTILVPQLLTTRGICITASTPPENLGHPYYSRRDRAVREGRFIQKTIFDNESLTPEQIQEECEQAGGEDSPVWRREYLCQPVADPSTLVIPEYNPDVHDVPDDYARPGYFDAYVGADLGFQDFTGFCFGYHDFLKQELVIENEICVAGWNSKQIVEKAISIEGDLWGTTKPYSRWSDNELQTLADMATLHGYQMHPTRKDDKMSAINELRLRFKLNKIKIKKRCTNLRYQLKVGSWDERKKSFLRGEVTGHLDLIDALVYLNRNVDTRNNPWPQNPNVAMDVFVDPEATRKPGQLALEAAFQSPFKR